MIKTYETAEQVFPKLGYPTKGALLKACQRQEVPHIRISPRKVLFDPEEITGFMESKKIVPLRMSTRR